MVAPFSKFYGKNLGWFLSLHWKTVFCWKMLSNRKTIGPSENDGPSFERSVSFYMTINGNFEPFQYFHFETNFLKNENLFQQGGGSLFSKNYQDWKYQHFHTKLPCRKPMLRQIGWGVQSGHITKNGVLVLTTLFCFLKILFQCKNLL